MSEARRLVAVPQETASDDRSPRVHDGTGHFQRFVRAFLCIRCSYWASAFNEDISAWDTSALRRVHERRYMALSTRSIGWNPGPRLVTVDDFVN